MPNLHHLRLCDHGVGYKGLEAIFDDCPHLKSLDLRLCSAFEKVSDPDMILILNMLFIFTIVVMIFEVNIISCCEGFGGYYYFLS